jgi:hypothetical protein
MTVMWAATSPESGRFSPVEKRSNIRDLSARLHELLARGQGYVEVRSPNREFPVLTLAFRDDHAVIHLTSDAELMSLLAGDGTLPSDAEVEVPIMDGLATFTGDFVMGIGSAWDVVHDFIRAVPFRPPGHVGGHENFDPGPA